MRGKNYVFPLLNFYESSDWTMDDIKRKRGRPRKEGNDRYNNRFSFHETEEQTYMRKALEEEMGKNGGEVIREALEILYNMKIGWKQ